jgi:hypothetical protein
MILIIYLCISTADNESSGSFNQKHIKNVLRLVIQYLKENPYKNIHCVKKLFYIFIPFTYSYFEPNLIIICTFKKVMNSFDLI